jgi:hypothetical protein
MVGSDGLTTSEKVILTGQFFSQKVETVKAEHPASAAAISKR